MTPTVEQSRIGQSKGVFGAREIIEIGNGEKPNLFISSKSKNGNEFSKRYAEPTYFPYELVFSVKSLYNCLWKYGVFKMLSLVFLTLIFCEKIFSRQRSQQ
jgi:hypothetical protein